MQDFPFIQFVTVPPVGIIKKKYYHLQNRLNKISSTLSMKVVEKSNMRKLLKFCNKDPRTMYRTVQS